MSFKIKGNFFCVFKTGDNIEYNLSILNYLYYLLEKSKEVNKFKLLKPIILIEISIVEAILHDFHLRIRANVREGVKGIEKTVIEELRNKKIDELKLYIVSARKYNFFKERDDKFYIDLDNLRKIRNRIHIQNSCGSKPADEIDVFSTDAKLLSEKCLEKVVKTISNNQPRPEGLRDFVGDLIFPWNEHYRN